MGAGISRNVRPKFSALLDAPHTKEANRTFPLRQVFVRGSANPDEQRRILTYIRVSVDVGRLCALRVGV